MEQNKISDAKFIFDMLEKMFEKQEADVIDYVNTVMTKKEKEIHGENLWYCLLKSKAAIAMIKMEMLVDGRNVE